MIENAEKATEIALSFIKQHYHFGGHPLKAKREDATWTVDIDVGMLLTEIVTVKIDAENGSIISYETK
jgi:hypothetical protein